MEFRITAKEKQMILKRRKAVAGIEDVAKVLTKLINYFESGTVRLERLESIVKAYQRHSQEGQYYVDLLSRIEDQLDRVTEDMELLRNSIMES